MLQVYEGLVYMDFNKELMESRKYGELLCMFVVMYSIGQMTGLCTHILSFCPLCQVTMSTWMHLSYPICGWLIYLTPVTLV